MKFINKIYLLIAILGITLSSCTDDNVVTNTDSDKGYVQIRIVPEMLTKSVTLESLSEIKKVELFLRYKGMDIVQTLTMNSIEGAADHGLLSERLALNIGDYTVLSYKLLGSVALGEESPKEITTIYPSESIQFDITSGHIYELELAISSKLRGKVSFKLEKDYSNYQDIIDEVNSTTKSTITQKPEDFKYSHTKEADIYYKKKGSSQRPVVLSVKTYSLSDENFLHTDSIQLESGEYEITRYMLYTKNRTEMILAADLENTYFTVLPNNFNRSSLPIVYPKNMTAIRDYIALYNIWKALDGENWSYSGSFMPEGANWRFEDRPIDEWGNQPGVLLSSKGRVHSINIGCFNPKGDVPAEIGVLTDLQLLTLGINSDLSIPNTDGITYVLSRPALFEEGVDLSSERMAIAKEELSIKYNKKSKYTLLDDKDLIETTYARAFTSVSNPINLKSGKLGKTNRITSIPEEIGNLKNVTHLYISGGFVKELPQSIANMSSLTDLEVYNCELEEFPSVLLNMPELVAINFSMNPSIPQDKMNAGINDFLANSPKLQIAYFNENNISEFPLNIKLAKNIGLLDMSDNKLKELPNLERAIAPVQAYFDNNEITYVDDKFCDTDDIETISFVNNKITEFPGLFGNGIGSSSKYKIETIDFTANQLSKFRPSFKGLHVGTLNLANNKFGENGKLFPDALADTESKISYLILDNNYLDTIPNSSFKNLGKYLEALQIKGNNLTSFPPVFNVEDLPYLTGIDCSINRFKSVPAQPFYIHSLMKFFITEQFDIDKRGKAYRCMQKFITGINTHPGLRYLDVSGNNILKIASNDFPGSLIGFNIMDNPNIEVYVSKVGCLNIYTGLISFLYDKTQDIRDCAYVELED